jgi:hypothetical protein
MRLLVLVVLAVLLFALGAVSPASASKPQPFSITASASGGPRNGSCYQEDDQAVWQGYGNIKAGESFSVQVPICEVALPNPDGSCCSVTGTDMVIQGLARAKKTAGLSVSITAPSGLSRAGLSRCYTPPQQRTSPFLSEFGAYTVTISATQDVLGASLFVQVYDEYAWFIQQNCPRQDWNFTPPIVHAPSVITGLTTITVDPALLLGDVASMDPYIDGARYPAVSVNGGFGTWSLTFDATGLTTGTHILTVKQTEGGSADVGDFSVGDPVSVAW